MKKRPSVLSESGSYLASQLIAKSQNAEFCRFSPFAEVYDVHEFAGGRYVATLAKLDNCQIDIFIVFTRGLHRWQFMRCPLGEEFRRAWKRSGRYPKIGTPFLKSFDNTRVSA